MNDTKRPLLLAEDISAIYIGAIISAAPTPKPPIIRATTNAVNELANAEAIAETANNNAVILSTGMRPSLSLKGPATIIPKDAVSAIEATAQPNSILLNKNSGSINFTTPEITEASKPIKKPPSATRRALNVPKLLLFFIVFEQLQIH